MSDWRRASGFKDSLHSQEVDARSETGSEELLSVSEEANLPE